MKILGAMTEVSSKADSNQAMMHPRSRVESFRLCYWDNMIFSFRNVVLSKTNRNAGHTATTKQFEQRFMSLPSSLLHGLYRRSSVIVVP